MRLASIKLPITSNAVCVEVPDKLLDSLDMIEFTLLLTYSDLPTCKHYCCVSILDDDGNLLDRNELNQADQTVDFGFVLSAETAYGLYKFSVDVVGEHWYIDIS